MNHEPDNWTHPDAYNVCPYCSYHTCKCEPDESRQATDDDCEEGMVECPFCDGTGETNSAVDRNGCVSFDCPECGGTGWC